MPTLCIIDSIKLEIYAHDHPPPHFHARYAEFEVLIEIKTLQLYAGTIPAPISKKIIAWAKQKGEQSFLLENYLRLNPDRQT
jgi:hypothetical protein